MDLESHRLGYGISIPLADFLPMKAVDPLIYSQRGGGLCKNSPYELRTKRRCPDINPGLTVCSGLSFRR